MSQTPSTVAWLDDFPNLQAIVAGRMAGPVGEWPALRGELQRLGIRFSEAQSFALTQRTAEALDAERYRYLRSAAGQYKEDDCGPMVCSGCGDNFEYLRGEEVDSEVDDAMAIWKAAGSPK